MEARFTVWLGACSRAVATARRPAGTAGSGTTAMSPKESRDASPGRMRAIVRTAAAGRSRLGDTSSECNPGKSLLHLVSPGRNQLTVAVLASGPIRSKRLTREGFLEPSCRLRVRSRTLSDRRLTDAKPRAGANSDERVRSSTLLTVARPARCSGSRRAGGRPRSIPPGRAFGADNAGSLQLWLVSTTTASGGSRSMG